MQFDGVEEVKEMSVPGAVDGRSSRRDCVTVMISWSFVLDSSVAKGWAIDLGATKLLVGGFGWVAIVGFE